MPLSPGNNNSYCSSRKKLWVEVLIPKKKTTIQVAWVMLRKSFGGQCLRFHSCVQQEINAYRGYMLFALWKEGVSGRDTEENQSVNFCPYMDFFDWFVCFNFSGLQLLLCWDFCLAGIVWELKALYEHSFGQWASFCTLRWKEKAYSLQLKKNISPVTSYFHTASWLMTQLVCSYISTTILLQSWQEFISYWPSEKSQESTRCCIVITFYSVVLLNDILWYIKRQLWILLHSSQYFAQYSRFPDEHSEYKNKEKFLNTTQHHACFVSITFQSTYDSPLAWEIFMYSLFI